MKPRLWAESVVVTEWFEGREREGLEILDICWGRPMSINSILDGLRDRKLEVIQDDMSAIVSWSWLTVVIKVSGAKEINIWVSSA